MLSKHVLISVYMLKLTVIQPSNLGLNYGLQVRKKKPLETLLDPWDISIMTGVQPMPCPVLLGTVKSGGLPALLHRYTIEKKVAKVEKVLKKGLKTYQGHFKLFLL